MPLTLYQKSKLEAIHHMKISLQIHHYYLGDLQCSSSFASAIRGFIVYEGGARVAIEAPYGDTENG